MRPDVPGLENLTEIGRGGFGVVYRAEDQAHGRTVAVKVLGQSLDASAAARFVRECRAAGALSGHPNIVSVHGSGVTEAGDPYLVMDHLPGGSLADRVRHRGPLGPQEAIELGVCLAGALQAAHERGIIHRDVKPENVLYSVFDQPQLVDFGIARMASEFETRSGSIYASLAYAPPEVLAGSPATEAADVYSLASLLHHALAGAAPFRREAGETLAPLIARITTAPPPDLRELGVPDELASVVERGLAKEPGERPSTAAELAAELQQASRDLGEDPPQFSPTVVIPAAAAAAAFAEAGLQPPGSVAAAPSPARPPGRRRLAAALAVVAVVAVVAGLLVRRGTGDDQPVGSGATTTRATADGEPSIIEDPVDHDGLSATRSYGFEEEGGTNLVGSQVVLANTTSETTRRIWFEAVPKDLAASVDDVRFLREPSGVLDEDPVVYWVVTLDPGAEATLGWSTPLPDGSSPDEATLAKVAAMHRSALDASADLIATATAALERLTGATATEPGGSEPGEGGGGQGEGTTVAEGTVTTTDGAGGTGGSDPTVVDQPTTTSGGKVTVTAAGTTTTAAPLAKPGAVTGVTVRSPAFVGGTNKSVRVSISWGAPTSGGGSITGYKVRHQQLWSGSCSSGSQAWVEASTGTARSTTQSADTQCGSSWVVWQVAAVNASGVGPYTTATGVMPDVIGAQNAYHLVRAVGGRAGGLAERDCGVAAYAACYTSVSAGASLSPGTSVGISQQTSG